MYREPIHPHQRSSFYDNYYTKQVGSALPVFHGSSIQYGEGLGNLLSGLFRSAMPLLKQGAATLGRTALQTSADIVEDALSGKNIKSSVKSRVRQAGRKLGSRAVSRAKEIAQRGRGRRRKTTRKTRNVKKRVKRKVNRKRPAIRRKAVKTKRPRIPDIFDF